MTPSPSASSSSMTALTSRWTRSRTPPRTPQLGLISPCLTLLGPGTLAAVGVLYRLPQLLEADQADEAADGGDIGVVHKVPPSVTIATKFETFGKHSLR